MKIKSLVPHENEQVNGSTVTVRELRHLLFEADHPGLTVTALRRILTEIDEQDASVTPRMMMALGNLTRVETTTDGEV